MNITLKNRRCTNETKNDNYDYLGQRCNCCYNNTNITANTYCTSDNYFLNGTNLTKWFNTALALTST